MKTLSLKTLLFALALTMTASFSAWALAQDAGAESALKSAVTSGKPTLLTFGAVWCPSCVDMHKVIDGVKKEKEFSGRINIISVDTDKDKDLASKYAIRSIPVQVLLDESGKEIKRHFGPLSKHELVKLMKGSFKPQERR